MNPSGPHSPRFAVLFLLTALLLSGCGLADYESRLKESEERLRDVDRYLGDALIVPPALEGETLPEDYVAVPVFLRPPRGIHRTPEGKRRGPLLHYANSDEGMFRAVYLVSAHGGKWKDFEQAVLAPFAGVEAGKGRGEEVLSFRGRTLNFLSYHYESATARGVAVLSIHLLEQGDDRAAVIFEGEAVAEDRAQLLKAIDLSRRSLVVGPDAAPMRALVPELPSTKSKR